MKTALLGFIPQVPTDSGSISITDPGDDLPDDITNLDEFITYITNLVQNAVTGMVPYFIALGETFLVPEFKQALYAMTIDVEGDLDVDGFLIEVD